MEHTHVDIVGSLRPIGTLYSAGRLEETLLELERLWSSLPEEKTAAPNAYLIVEYSVAVLLQLGNLAQARQWAERGLAFRDIRQDLGETEFLLGKVAYEQGDLDEARSLIDLAVSKSHGRILVGADPKYRQLASGGH